MPSQSDGLTCLSLAGVWPGRPRWRAGGRTSWRWSSCCIWPPWSLWGSCSWTGFCPVDGNAEDLRSTSDRHLPGPRWSYRVRRRPLFGGGVILITADVKLVGGKEADRCFSEAFEDRPCRWTDTRDSSCLVGRLKGEASFVSPFFSSWESWSCSSRALISPPTVRAMMASTSARSLLSRKLKSPNQKTWSKREVTSAAGTGNNVRLTGHHRSPQVTTGHHRSQRFHVEDWRLTYIRAVGIGVWKVFGKSQRLDDLVVIQNSLVDFGVSGWKRNQMVLVRIPAVTRVDLQTQNSQVKWDVMNKNEVPKKVKAIPKAPLVLIWEMILVVTVECSGAAGGNKDRFGFIYQFEHQCSSQIQTGRIVCYFWFL